MGRDRRESSPSNVIRAGRSEAIAANSLIPVPELPILMTPAGSRRLPPVPEIVQMLSLPRLIQAPKVDAAVRLEMVSAETSGDLIMDVPFARVAITSARMVCDFDPGA